MCLAILLAKTSHQRETPYRLRMLSAYGASLRHHNVRAFFNACTLSLSAVFQWNHSSTGALPQNETQTHTLKGTENTLILLNKLTFSLTQILCNSIFYILRINKMTTTTQLTQKDFDVDGFYDPDTNPNKALALAVRRENELARQQPKQTVIAMQNTKRAAYAQTFAAV